MTETEAARPGIGDGRGVHHGLHRDQGGSIPPASKKTYYNEVQAYIKPSQTLGSTTTSCSTPASALTRPVPVPSIPWTAVPSQPSQSSKKRQECDQDPRKRRRSQCEEEGSQEEEIKPSNFIFNHVSQEESLSMSYLIRPGPGDPPVPPLHTTACATSGR